MNSDFWKSQNYSNVEERKKRQIKYIVIHYTNLPSTKASLKHLVSKKNKVSSHYLVDPRGKTYSLVEEKTSPGTQENLIGRKIRI